MPYIDDGFEALLEPFYNGKKLTDPISTVEDKNQLLPAFLKVKGMCENNEQLRGTMLTGFKQVWSNSKLQVTGYGSHIP